jgi:hypothetical protein
VQSVFVEPGARIRLLEDAASELLESETNGSLTVGVRGSACEPLLLTALGDSVLVAVGQRASMLISMSSLTSRGSGPHVLAAGCDRTLRTVHGLSADFVPTLCFGDPANATRFQGRYR